MTGTLESFKADLTRAAERQGVKLEPLPDEPHFGCVYRASKGGKSVIVSFTFADVDAANFAPGLMCSAIVEELARYVEAIGIQEIEISYVATPAEEL